jgi:hypothetical protein
MKVRLSFKVIACFWFSSLRHQGTNIHEDETLSVNDSLTTFYWSLGYPYKLSSGLILVLMVTNMVTKIFHIFLSHSATNIPRNETFLFKQASPFENMRSVSNQKFGCIIMTYSYYYHVLKTSDYCFWSRSLEKMMKKNSWKTFLFRREAGLRRHVQGAPERLHHRQGQQVRDPSF